MGSRLEWKVVCLCGVELCSTFNADEASRMIAADGPHGPHKLYSFTLSQDGITLSRVIGEWSR